VTLALVMIVRDEAAVLPRLLANVRPAIDHWTICDTGSTDGTRALIREQLADVPGQLIRQNWHDFGTNQTAMIRAAYETADYLLHLGADETLGGSLDLDALDQPSYAVTVADGGPAFTFPRLLSGKIRWRYVGKAHAYPTSDEEPVPGRTLLDGLTIVHHGDGHRAMTRTRFSQTRDLLEQAYAEDPNDPRTVYYLANTYRDLARGLYQKRATMGGWQAEVEKAAEQAERMRSLGVPSLV
jgi:glycosyltransferase involved in cell wall biosynthesis